MATARLAPCDPRACDLLFHFIQTKPGDVSWHVEGSYYEIYNEKIGDLLDKSDGSHEVLGKSSEVSFCICSMGWATWRTASVVDEDVNWAAGHYRSRRLCDVFWQGEIRHSDGMSLPWKLLDR